MLSCLVWSVFWYLGFSLYLSPFVNLIQTYFVGLYVGPGLVVCGPLFVFWKLFWVVPLVIVVGCCKLQSIWRIWMILVVLFLGCIVVWVVDCCIVACVVCCTLCIVILVFWWIVSCVCSLCLVIYHLIDSLHLALIKQSVVGPFQALITHDVSATFCD